MADPVFVALLVTITKIWLGNVAGGDALFPGRVVQLTPHAGTAGVSVKPLNAEGAPPPDSTLFFAHCDPQKLTLVPVASVPAARPPMTNAPAARGGNTVSTSSPHVVVAG